MDEYARGYRKQFRSYGGSEGGLEIVSGKVYSANHPVCAVRGAPEPQEAPPRRQPQQLQQQQHKRKKDGVAWGMSDAETKRRRRVAAYKAYGVEGKMKASLRNGFRWVKVKCSKLVRGF